MSAKHSGALIYRHDGSAEVGRGAKSWSLNFYFLHESWSGWEFWDKHLPIPAFWERSRELTKDSWQELLGLAEASRPFDTDFLELLWHQQEIFAVYVHERRKGLIVRLLADTSDLPADPRITLGIFLITSRWLLPTKPWSP